jgi:hypothetical protein
MTMLVNLTECSLFGELALMKDRGVRCRACGCTHCSKHARSGNSLGTAQDIIMVQLMNVAGILAERTMHTRPTELTRPTSCGPSEKRIVLKPSTILLSK